jgi:hypothetical protein
MSLLNDASLVLIPSGYKEDKVYSIIPSDGSGDLDFVRGSDGTRINSLGQVERTPWNRFLFSEQFDNAEWNKTNCTISANSTTAPNGTLTADKLIMNNGQSGSSGDGTGVRQIYDIESSNYVFSVYAKKAEFSTIRFRENQVTGAFLTVDLNDGTITNGDTNQFINPIATLISNGWYRISFGTPVITSIYRYSIRVSENGNGSSGIYIWGAQFNAGALKPYFPTTDRLNVPRLTYENGCPSLLLEKQSTNLLLWSDQLDNAVHSRIGISTTANNITSPDGTQNADKIIETTANSEHILYDFDSNAPGTYTLSAFFKGGAGTIFPVLRLNGSDSTQYAGCIFNTSTGAVVNTFYNTYSAPTTKVENMGNGWYRVSMTTTTTNTNYGMRIAASDSASPSLGSYGSITYTGSTSNYFYAWGAQLEASAYPTSYIPTTSTSVTRLADSCYKAGISSLIGQTEGTLFIDTIIEDIANQTNDPVLLYLVGSSQVYIEITSSGIIYGVFYNGSTSTGFINANVGLTNGRHKIAFAYKTDDFTLYLDGIEIGTDTSGIVSGALSEFGLQYIDSYYHGKQKVNQALLFKRRLTNTELAQLTTI